MSVQIKLFHQMNNEKFSIFEMFSISKLQCEIVNLLRLEKKIKLIKGSRFSVVSHKVFLSPWLNYHLGQQTTTLNE